MDLSWLSRTSLLVGDEGLQKLVNAHVMVLGLGGVGSFAAEFIARSGVGKMTIIDGDNVDVSNRNRQLPALVSTIGMPKAEVMSRRLKDINPEITLDVINDFITPDRVAQLIALKPDYIVDAIDSVTPKLTFMSMAYNSGLPFVSSMGAGGKLDPTQIKITDISQTYNCPFAHLIRKQLRRKHKIYTGIKAVFSTEKNIKESLMLTDGSLYKRSAYGTISYLPAAFGGVCASVAIRDLLQKNNF